MHRKWCARPPRASLSAPSSACPVVCFKGARSRGAALNPLFGSLSLVKTFTPMPSFHALIASGDALRLGSYAGYHKPHKPGST